MEIGDIIPIIVALLSPGIWQLFVNRKKDKADTIKIEEEAKKVKAETAEIIQRLATEQIEYSEKKLEEKEQECKNRIEVLEKDNRTIKASLTVIKRDLRNLFEHYYACAEGAHLLVKQVLRHKEEPCYMPPPMDIVKKRKTSLQEEL